NPFGGLGGCSIILVEHATAQGAPLRIEWRDGWRLASQSNGSDAVSRVGELLPNSLQYRKRAIPPGVWILFGPGGMIVIGGVVCGALGHKLAVEYVGYSPRATCSDIQRQYDVVVRHCHDPVILSVARLSRSPSDSP